MSAPPKIERKPLVLKRGPNGKLQLPISELRNIAVRIPPGGLPAGYRVVFMQDVAANTTVGITKDDIDVTPIEDVTRLYEIPRLVKKCEDDVARASKTLTAQRLLFDRTDAKEREDSKIEPSPEYEAAAIDSHAASEIIVENVRILEQSEGKVPEENLARNFLVEESYRILQVAKKWLLDMAKGKPTPKTLLSALKEAGISNWVYTRLMKPVPDTTRSWSRFLFPKDPSKGIRMTAKEFSSTMSDNKSGQILFAASTAIFTTVELYGETRGNKSDKEASYPLIPVFTDLKELAQVRVKSFKLDCISKLLQSILSAIYNMARAILPLEEDSRKQMLPLLFKDPDYDPNQLQAPLQQIVEKPSQEFIFWKTMEDPKVFLKAMEYYGTPKLTLDKLESKEFTSPIRPVTIPKIGDIPKLSPKMENVSIKPRVGHMEPDFIKFQSLLEERGILQRRKKERNRRVLYTFMPQANSKAVLDLVNKVKTFQPIIADVERFLNSIKNSKIRESAAEQLYAALSNMKQTGKVHIRGLNLDIDDPNQDVNPDENDEDDTVAQSLD